MTLTDRILAKLPGDVLEGLSRADRLWQALRQDSLPYSNVVEENSQPLGSANEWDVVVCGGTLGILIACVLAQQGWRVALIERGQLRGREQEWNISRSELSVFLELGLLSEAELERAIATEYNPARIGFFGGNDLWVNNVLNVGVSPVLLLEMLKTHFLAAGGQLFENTPFERAIVHPDGVIVEAKQQFRTRLLLDVMGHFSPIARQARQGQRPDAVCLVVGSCAQGFLNNETGDLIFSFAPIQNQCQYFWEAFPARDGRTTYLFTYLDAHPDRLSLATLFEDYLRLLPEYQGIELAQLQFQRALFGFFPCYRRSPLQFPWNRILPLGDSSGSQSPLSFGGFGATIRHLRRLAEGIREALHAEALSCSALALLQPYQPNLSVTWLFQRAMSVRMEQKLPPNQINELLSGVFGEMAKLGADVLEPFLKDVVQFSPLSRTLLRTNLQYPQLVAKIVPQVGLPALFDWMRHYLNLGIYTALHPVGKNLDSWTKPLSPTQQYYYHRWLQAWQYGSGRDYTE